MNDCDKKKKTEEDLSNWKGCPPPSRETIDGFFMQLEPLDIQRHAKDLYDLTTTEEGIEERTKYLWEDMPKCLEDYEDDLKTWLNRKDRCSFVIRNKRTRLIDGRVSYQNIVAEHGKCEVGPVYSYGNSPDSIAAKHEAVIRVMEPLMNAGYRRCEYKIWTKNYRSLKGVQRLGLLYEGTLRHSFVMKGHTRDDAWFAVTIDEWPFFKHMLDLYASPGNVAANGSILQTMTEIRGQLLRLPEYKHICYRATNEYFQSINIK